MAVYFSPKVILYNAFYAKQEAEGIGSCSLSFPDLRKFCSDLYDSIVSLGYKYVVIGCDEKDMNAFYEKNHDFVKGIDKVFCVRKIDSIFVNDLNRTYPEDIQSLLRRLPYA